MSKVIKTIRDCTTQVKNANKHSQRGLGLLEDSIQKDGWIGAITIAADGETFDGSARLEVGASAGFEDAIIVESDGTKPVIVRRIDIATADDEKARRLGINANRIAQVDLVWDTDVLTQLAADGMDLSDLFTGDEFTALLQDEEGAGGELLTDADEVPDNAPTRCKAGDLWQLGRHRLLCGDSTKPEDVERLMGGEKAALCHADPPYGMGKEKDGVENDNLYSDKLDAFQMAWWKAVRAYLEDNASIYIWGDAEGLWRLWWRGGLSNIERLTLRNEIVWQKRGAQGIGSEAHRMYPTSSERCLFFMLGEQGFNNNADNYWEGFEPIRAYLDGERLKMGWTKPHVEKILDSVNKTQHIFSISHFNLITEVDYERLQKEANDKAFKREYDDLKREYDDLKREFNGTRAYFNNAHENMTDVWEFGRVTGDDRHDHATPKPVAMIERAIKSSAPEGSIVIEPFLGSGTTLIAAEQTGRKCYGIEISPKYCDVIIARFENATGTKAELNNNGSN